MDYFDSAYFDGSYFDTAAVEPPIAYTGPWGRPYQQPVSPPAPVITDEDEFVLLM